MNEQIENYALVQPGNVEAILISVIDLGDHDKTWNQVTKKKPIVRLEFEVPSVMNGEYPATVKVELPVYAFDKAKIYPYFTALDIDVQNDDTVMDLINKLGKKINKVVTLTIGTKDATITKQEDGSTKNVRFNVIEGIQKSKGEDGQPKSKTSFFCQGITDIGYMEQLPEYIRRKINVRDSAIDSLLGEPVKEEDLPF